MSYLRILAVTTIVVAASSCATPQFQAGPCENGVAAIDGDFEGARMSACAVRGKNFLISIAPENRPINPSPWYAFRVTPRQPGEISVELMYEDARHRYAPKQSSDQITWRALDPGRVSVSGDGREARIDLVLGADPLIIAGQELILQGAYDRWMTEIAASGDVELRQIGRSVEGRPISALIASPDRKSAGKREVVLLIGRQHPPEVTGAIAMLPFVDTVLGASPLAKTFRERFHVIVAPFLNPDGVHNGHWRHNMNGVDLNRDWGEFTQPETLAMKAILDDVAFDEGAELRLMLDFHSTNRNVFYVQPDEDITTPAGFVGEWLDGARLRLDDYEFERADRHQADLPTSKNYVYGRFGAPAITYEVGDDTDRQGIRESAVIFAEEMMKVLLKSDPTAPDRASSGGE